MKTKIHIIKNKTYFNSSFLPNSKIINILIGMTTLGLGESEDGRLAQSDRSLWRRPGMNMDNEKDYESIPIPIAQQGKRQNPVQGEPSKTDPERVICPICQKDFKVIAPK